MAIIKRKKTSNFTVVANGPFQREDMTAEAKGMLAYLLTLPGDWELNMSDLENRHKDCKRDKTRRVIHELMSFGYIVRERRQDPETGHMKGWDYVVDDEPRLPNERNEDATDLLKNRQSVKPTVGQPATTKYTDKLNKQERKKENVVSLREADTRASPPGFGEEESPPSREQAPPPEAPPFAKPAPKPKPSSKDVDFEPFFDAWNELAPNLPRVTERGRRGNNSVKSKIRALVKEFGVEEALSIFRDACREVNLDDFWQQRRYNIENMMRHVTVKADNWAARQSRPQPKKKPHDGIENDPLADWFRGGDRDE